MKKLTNVSPFLLLLVPVFVMMILTFASGTNAQNEEMASKSVVSKEAVVQLSSPFSK